MKIYSFLGKIFSYFFIVVVAAYSAVEKTLTAKGPNDNNH